MLIISTIVALAIFSASAWQLHRQSPCCDETLRAGLRHNEKFANALTLMLVIMGIMTLLIGASAFVGIIVGLSGVLVHGLDDGSHFAMLLGGLLGATLFHHMRSALVIIEVQKEGAR